MNTLGLLNTRIGVYLPMVAMPIGVFLIRQFLINIPQELEDAARMDGCNSMTLLIRILLPLSIPALGALTIWIFIFAWNEFFWSMISLKKSAMLTLPIGLKTIMGSQNIEYGILFGASLLALIPSLVIFVVLRKRIISGISISGAIK
jgi:ABC-type glycerol-3-phosphate transport system permease component